MLGMLRQYSQILEMRLFAKLFKTFEMEHVPGTQC